MERRDGDLPLSHRGLNFGVLEESGRPRNPVTVDTTGSNPVHTAKLGKLVPVKTAAVAVRFRERVAIA